MEIDYVNEGPVAKILYESRDYWSKGKIPFNGNPLEALVESYPKLDGNLIDIIFKFLPGISVRDCIITYLFAASRKRANLAVDKSYLTWLWFEMTGEIVAKCPYPKPVHTCGQIAPAPPRRAPKQSK